jgi:PAS domain S-box-containing protein
MNKPQILVIDDETIIHNTMRKALKNTDLDLSFAANGKEALKIMKKSTPALIFLDLAMPVMDGFAFLDHIAIKPEDPYLVVVITGHGDDQEVKKSYEKGVNFFLRKPLSMIEVSCLAKRLIEVKAIEREIREHRDNLEKLVEERTATIKEQLHFQQNLLDSIPTPVMFKDAELRYLGCNSAFERFVGMKKKKIIGKTAHDVLDEETAELEQTEDKKTLEKGNTFYETTAVFKDGTLHDVIVSKAVFKNSDGEIGGLICAMLDITDRKRAEASLEIRSQELTEANAALRVVLDQIGTAKSAVEKRVYRNIKDLILPDLDKLKFNAPSADMKRDINGIKANLSQLLSAPTERISSVYLTLSPREIQIADLIRMGRSTKSIALLLNITKSAVEFHRNNLREKMGIKHRHVNLRSYLMDTD